jgi:hypothetical protein
MQPYQERVVAERDELHEKIEKLAIFLDTPTYQNLPQPEQQRLLQQLVHMNDYLAVLDERTAAFT